MSKEWGGEGGVPLVPTLTAPFATLKGSTASYRAEDVLPVSVAVPQQLASNPRAPAAPALAATRASLLMDRTLDSPPAKGDRQRQASRHGDLQEPQRPAPLPHRRRHLHRQGTHPCLTRALGTGHSALHSFSTLCTLHSLTTVHRVRCRRALRRPRRARDGGCRRKEARTTMC